MNGAMMLQHAAGVIEDRWRTYSPPERSFTDTAARWSLVLGVDVSPAQVALCQIHLKLARLTRHPAQLESIIAVGYAGLLREVTRS